MATLAESPFVNVRGHFGRAVNCVREAINRTSKGKQQDGKRAHCD